MPARYSFTSRWLVPAPADRVWTEVERMLRPGADRRWWPGLTLPMAPRRLVPGERMVLAVRSPLGYVLRMRLQLTEIAQGRSVNAASDGDLRGGGRVVVDEDGAEASVVTFQWDVETRRRWMNATAWALRPAFERAHAHVMRRGEQGMGALLAGARSEPRNTGNPRFSHGRRGAAGYR